jgi:hypothetical protein
MQLGMGPQGVMLPLSRSLTQILSPSYMDETLLAMTGEWQVIIHNVTSALLAVEKCPPGANITNLPVAKQLGHELANMNVWFLQQQTRGGINLLQEFLIWLYNQVGFWEH